MNTHEIICSECGRGNFEPSADGPEYVCRRCGSVVAAGDIIPNLQPGESLLVVDGVLVYVIGTATD